MIILRRLFSKGDGDKKSNKTRNSLAAGVGLIGTEAVVLNPLNYKLSKNIDKNIKETHKKDKESHKIYKKIKKDFLKDPNSMLEEGKTRFGDIIREDVSGIVSEGPSKGKKIIRISGGSTKDASILSHEMGHIHYLSNPKADKIGKYAHKIDSISNNSTLIGLGAGIASGVRSAKKEEKGEKEGLVNRSSGALASIGAHLPRLVAEGKASQHGYKLMKNAGASERLLKSAKGNYKKALLSYGAGIVSDIGISELGRSAGRAYYNNIIKTDKKDDNSKK